MADGFSGLAVENPDQKRRGPIGIVQDILKQASSNSFVYNPNVVPDLPSLMTRRKNAAAQQPRSGFFGGSGHTLGSDETPSVPVNDPNSGPSQPSSDGGPRVAAVNSGMFDNILAGMMGNRGAGPAAPPAPEEDEEEEEVQTRHLIFWRNGFSIEDGPLMAYDAPGNQDILRAIQSGRAPPSLFGVRYNQPLQVEVAQRTGEDYVQQPKRKLKGFQGEGNRLGSPAPAIAGAGPAAGGGAGDQGQVQGIMAGGSGGMVSQGAATGNSPQFQLDDSKPTTNIQLRLADGSK